MSYQDDEEVKMDDGFEEEETDAELDADLDDPILDDDLLADDDELSDEEEEGGFADLNGNEY